MLPETPCNPSLHLTGTGRPRRALIRNPQRWDCALPRWIVSCERYDVYTTYKTVIKMSSNDFDAAVSKLLSDGWQLYGDPYVNQGGYYCQALIK